MQHSIHILCRLCITHITLCTQTQHSTAQRSTDIGWQKTHWKTEKHMFVYCWTIASFLRQWHGWRRIRALRWSVNGKANHVRMKHMQFQGIVNLTHSHFLRNCIESNAKFMFNCWPNTSKNTKIVGKLVTLTPYQMCSNAIVTNGESSGVNLASLGFWVFLQHYCK